MQPAGDDARFDGATTMQTMTMNPADAGARRRVRLLWLAMLMAVLATVAVAGWAQPMGHGPRAGMGGMMMGGSPERIGRMIDHLLDGLNATDAQRSQIKQIAQAASADVKAQREAGRGLRKRGLQLFTAPNVDPAAVEALRQQMLAQHDQTSRRITQAMLDISRVLTPEQRAKIGERMQARAARMRDRMERMQRERPNR